MTKKKGTVAYKKSYLLEVMITYASSPAHAHSTRRPNSVDNVQLSPTRACKLVLVSVPNPFQPNSKISYFPN